MQRLLLALGVCLLLTASLYAQDTQELPITKDTEYTIQVGDTLEVIGATFDVSPTCLQEINEITNPSRINIGDVINISISCPLYGEDLRDDATLTVAVPREVSTYEDTCTGYRAEYRESVNSIAFDYDIAPQALIDANELEAPYQLEFNQCLQIPDDAPPYDTPPEEVLANPEFEGGGAGVPGTFYTMQRGDTLDVIAQENNVSVDAIKQINQITRASELQPGTIILIPDDAPVYGSVMPATPIDLSGAGGANALHVVQPRETADLIAAYYDAQLACLLETNEITNARLIQPGDVLSVSSECPPYTGLSSPDLITPLEFNTSGSAMDNSMSESTPDADSDGQDETGKDSGEQDGTGEAVPLGERDNG